MGKKILRKKRVWIPVLVFLFVLGAGIWYVNDYYHSDESVQKYLQESGAVTVTEMEEGLLLDGEGTEKAMIFYPGAKVEYTAYVPLLVQIAEQGVDCFVVKMPCNLAILGQNKADRIMEAYEYEHWYMAGHSLGGAIASSYASKNLEELDGLLLLAAYPMSNLQDSGVEVLSVYGSEDLVLNWENLEKGRSYMPTAYAEVCIEGGNHACFGNYGEQKGDGVAIISREEQQEQTVAAVCEMFLGQEKRGNE